MGYGDKKKWQKALGGQYGCLYIDEINTADIDFVREASMRCDYFMATLNPDDPNLPVYKEYINCSRPVKKYEKDTPKTILNMLCEEPKPDWVHWFFSFDDNFGLSKEKIEQIKLNVPVGTKLYKNKILGERGRATGLVFSNFDRKIHVVTKKWAQQFLTADRRKEHFVYFTSGLDTAYSQSSPDTVAMTFFGITNKGKCIQLDEKKYNNAELEEPLAPSDIARNYVDFLERNRDEWGFARNVYIDSADQATITELNKYKRKNGCAYSFYNAFKKTKIIDRINLLLGWFAKKCYYIVEHCTNTIQEYELYSWLEDKDNTPEDGHDHFINSSQYGWLPFKEKIGSG